jgi:hypothetical protein
VSATGPCRALVGRVAERAILAGCLRSTLDGQRQVDPTALHAIRAVYVRGAALTR